MTYYIDLNSGYRDRIDNPNPFHYVVSSRQMDTWFQKLKFKDHCILEMTLEHVILPYQGFLLDQPKLYLDIYFYGPLPFRRNIEMIDDHLRRAKFSLIKDKVVHGSSGAPAWIHYKSTNVQQLIYTDCSLRVVRATSMLLSGHPLLDHPLIPKSLKHHGTLTPLMVMDCPKRHWTRQRYS